MNILLVVIKKLIIINYIQVFNKLTNIFNDSNLLVFIELEATGYYHAETQIQHMQKTLSQINLQPHNVINNLTSDTGLKIISDILAEQSHTKILSQHRDRRCKNQYNKLGVVEVMPNQENNNLEVLKSFFEEF